jgi:hypothetical protein
VKDLVALTGLDEGRVVEIVDRLASQGALDVEGRAAAKPEADAEDDDAKTARLAAVPEELGGGDPAAEESGPELFTGTEVPEPPPSSQELLPEDPAELERDANDERNYRRLYETTFRPMDREGRIAAAAKEEGANLFALCLDAEPQVIHALLTNHRFGLDHARLVASHHPTHTGLEVLGRRNEFIRDRGVERRLLSNAQLPGSLLRKMVGPKLIMDLYKVCVSREFPERTRVMCREHLCKKFTLGSADERAALLIKTEGRCLVLLLQVALDARTTQILVGKTTYSVLFIQNLARWPATPPQLLAHLLKQAVVRQNIGLRKLVLKHPNVPKEMKRNLSV